MEDNKTITAAEELEEQDGSGRMFTQEEVNHIIKQRLAKVKEINKATEEEIAKQVEEATASRTAELDAREKRLECRSYLIENGYPEELLDALDTSDAETFKQKADTLAGIIAKNRPVAPLGSGEPVLTGKLGGALQDAFSANNAHKPKKWPPIYKE